MPMERPFPLSPAIFDGHSRVVPGSACFDWLHQAWAIFSATPRTWLTMTTLCLILLLALVVVPFIGFLAAALFYPLLATGMFAACRQAREPRGPSFPDLFTGLRGPVDGLLQVGVINLAGTLLTILVGSLALDGINLARGPGFFLGSLALVCLVALVLGLPLLMCVCFAPPLVAFQDMPPLAALQASFAACLKNWLPFTVFGVIFMVLGFFSTLILGLGFLVLIPVLFGTLYAAYRDIFVGI